MLVYTSEPADACPLPISEPADVLVSDKKEVEVEEIKAVEVEVVYVKTHTRKFKHVFDPYYNDDLTHSWGYYWTKKPPEWEGEAYYISTRDLIHAETGLTIPAGSHFLLSELTEGKMLSEVEAGDFMCMTCLDPRDDNKTLSFGFWHGIQEDQSHNFAKVDNDMVVLAIAATGLAK